MYTQVNEHKFNFYLILWYISSNKCVFLEYHTFLSDLLNYLKFVFYLSIVAVINEVLHEKLKYFLLFFSIMKHLYFIKYLK